MRKGRGARLWSWGRRFSVVVVGLACFCGAVAGEREAERPSATPSSKKTSLFPSWLRRLRVAKPGHVPRLLHAPKPAVPRVLKEPAGAVLSRLKGQRKERHRFVQDPFLTLHNRPSATGGVRTAGYHVHRPDQSPSCAGPNDEPPKRSSQVQQAAASRVPASAATQRPAACQPLPFAGDIDRQLEQLRESVKEEAKGQAQERRAPPLPLDVDLPAPTPSSATTEASPRSRPSAPDVPPSNDEPSERRPSSKGKQALGLPTPTAPLTAERTAAKESSSASRQPELPDWVDRSMIVDSETLNAATSLARNATPTPEPQLNVVRVEQRPTQETKRGDTESLRGDTESLPKAAPGRSDLEPGPFDNPLRPVEPQGQTERAVEHRTVADDVAGRDGQPQAPVARSLPFHPLLQEKPEREQSPARQHVDAGSGPLPWPPLEAQPDAAQSTSRVHVWPNRGSSLSSEPDAVSLQPSEAPGASRAENKPNQPTAGSDLPEQPGSPTGPFGAGPDGPWSRSTGPAAEANRPASLHAGFQSPGRSDRPRLEEPTPSGRADTDSQRPSGPALQTASLAASAETGLFDARAVAGPDDATGARLAAGLSESAAGGGERVAASARSVRRFTRLAPGFDPLAAAGDAARWQFAAGSVRASSFGGRTASNDEEPAAAHRPANQSGTKPSGQPAGAGLVEQGGESSSGAGDGRGAGPALASPTLDLEHGRSEPAREVELPAIRWNVEPQPAASSKPTWTTALSLVLASLALAAVYWTVALKRFGSRLRRRKTRRSATLVGSADVDGQAEPAGAE